MVRNFRGQVKISDVQDEFNNLVDGINNMVNSYNAAVDTTETVDYTKGGTTLAPIGYTLTIGGLKQVLNLYNNTVLGSEVYKIADGNYYVSNGIYIKDGKPVRLNQGLVQGSGDILYYDLTHNAYTFGDKYVVSAEGGATVVTKPFVLPPITSNVSYGVISGGLDGSKGLEGDLYEVLKGNILTVWANSVGSDACKNTGIVFKWVFQEPLKINQLTAQFRCRGNVAAYMKDLDGNILSQSSIRMPDDSLHTLSYAGGNNEINGIYIEARVCNTGGFAMFQFGNVKISAEDIQEVSIPETEAGTVDKNNLIKIADLNTNRIVKLCNTPNFTAEKIEGFKLGVKSIDVNDGNNMPLQNGNKGQFLSVFRRTLYKNDQYAKLFGVNITGGQHRDDNVGCYFGPVTRLFIPKGLPNPFTNQWWQLVTDYIVKRQPFKQT